MIRKRTLVTAFVFLLSSTVVPASEKPIDYLTQIKPLLEAKCYSCHGALKQEAELRLETLSLMADGGDSGSVLTAGKPEESLLLERITDDEESRMPPADEGAALKPDEVALLRSWIAQGAEAPEEDIPLAPAEHWAFLRIEKPIVNQGEVNPIDALLNANRSESGVKLQPMAGRSILIRRLYLNLTGLPPTLAQLHDQRPWADIVDELLGSPHHGERWGRHWMDILRYSDWYGLGQQLRYSQKHMWHWRDWIVDSLNDDKGYDRMILEMLAGDELSPSDPDVVAGTGFLARNYYLFNRTTWLDGTIEHTGKAFLGLTLNCAKCHDHKYDPISQEDYYSFRAIFEPHQVRLDPLPGTTNFEKDGLPRVFDDQLDAETFLHVRGDEKNPDKDLKITPRVPSLLASFQPAVTPVDLPVTAYAPGLRDYVQKDHLVAAEKAVKTAKDKLAVAQAKAADVPAETAVEHANFAFSFTDDFSKPNPDAWELVGDGWQYVDGDLHQKTASRNKSFLRLKKQLPRDFDLTCRYTTTGGPVHRSVTFRFDESQNKKYANLVYTSAHSATPKVQVSYSRGGTVSYPGDGSIAQPVKVGEEIELRFAVRDRLINVWFNGKLATAYTFADRRSNGRFTLSGFDATVAFHSLKIETLESDVKLVESKNKVPPSLDEAKAAAMIAAAKLKAEELRYESIKAIIAADRAKYGQASADVVSKLARTAAELEVAAKKADAAHDLQAAGGNKKKVAAANKKATIAQYLVDKISKGNFAYTSLRASRKALESPVHKEPQYAAVYSATSSGRRLSLARWMVSRDNPLTARVAVNHVWTRHFGEPLVESVFDFGLRAKKPRHADLLDFLAVEFMDSGWSFKHLHRLIVTSETYQLTSSELDADADTLAADPENQLYWRMNARRMESQIVRDSLLQLSETLDSTLGGPSLDVKTESRRRSLYFKHSRDDQSKFLTMFDDADLLQCYRRSESIVPQQALALANSKLSMTLAKEIAAVISEKVQTADQNRFIDAAFETLLGREATADEHDECLSYCEQIQQLMTEDDKSGEQVSQIQTRLIHSLINHNDFITIR